MIGHPLRRLEDPRLVRGEGAYVDDAPLEGGWHAVFVRSVEAHAFVRSIKLEDFAPEGARMFTAADLGLTEPMPVQHPSPRIQQPTNAPPLATTEVCYVGQPIAVVVARSMHDAVDAVEAVTVEDEELAPILDYRKALAPESPIAHAGAGSNLIAQLTAGYGDVGEAMARAPHTTTFEVDQHRGAGASLETRGVVASWHEDEPQLVIRTSSQSPHAVRGAVASYLGLSPDDVRVVTPDVGGGFGPKAVVYPEEYVLAALARHLGESVKWVEGRREHFTATLHQRGQGGTVEAGFDDDGKILALRARLIHDFGAFVPYGVVVPITTLRLISGPYVIPAVDVRIDCVFTNATPTAAIRGAGRPNAVFVTERVMDAIAHETGIDRAEVRRRNFIPTGALPYRIDLPGSNGKWVEYDSGDYERALDQAMATAEVADFERRKTASKGNGMRRGYGMASYVEDTGVGPYDGARVEVLPNGEVLLEIGTSAQGQGHATVYAQIVAQHLGVSPEMVRVRAGDTQRYGQGMGTVASRTAQGAASAVHVAAAALADDIKKRVADRLEASVDDIVLERGVAMVVGQPDTETSLAHLSAEAQPRLGGTVSPGQTTPGLTSERLQPFEGSAFTFGTHIAEVEIDPETGVIRVVGYTVVHDCGTMLNPMIVDGQVDGGVAHGLGNALRESVRYSENGQPLTASFMDYLLTSADDMPPLKKVHTETPAPSNPLGAKGAGEGGTIPAAAAIASAVEHALSDRGIRVDHYPVTSEWVFKALAQPTDPT